MRLPQIDFIDDKAGKPVGIQKFIGKRPIAAFGGLGQLAAAVVFVINMWTRVRMPGGVAPPSP